ncbi:hypothetical protein BJ165DRAFT_402520 [Panaeolus papilionaceus]|nr:hypothetical protein BJ165DRAFT_402520 [Panaeolus papilionaceus]
MNLFDTCSRPQLASAFQLNLNGSNVRHRLIERIPAARCNRHFHLQGTQAWMHNASINQQELRKPVTTSGHHRTHRNVPPDLHLPGQLIYPIVSRSSYASRRLDTDRQNERHRTTWWSCSCEKLGVPPGLFLPKRRNDSCEKLITYGYNNIRV